MGVFVAQLNDLDARSRLEAEARKQQAESERKTMAPLEVRLQRVLSSIPLDEQRAGLSLATLQISLRGRYRGNAHPGELGRALRKLGFVRERAWRSDTQFSALWRRAS
jgi:hypothetical protein